MSRSTDRLKRWSATIGAYVAVLIYPTVLLVALLERLCMALLSGFAAAERSDKIRAGDVAVVTGAAHGLGKAIAMELAAKGCHVAVVDINVEAAEQVAQHLHGQYKVKAKAYKVDVSDYLQVAALRDSVESDLGPATILVNNAAVLMLREPTQPAWQDVQRMINVNLTAHFWTNSVFLPKMKQLRRGHIVAISSASSFFPLIYNSEYTSTKFAVRGLMRVLRQELKAAHYADINTTTVFPSFLQTNEEVARIVRKTGTDAFFPLITGEAAAKQVLRAMLRNEEEIALPGFIALLYRCFESFPAVWQDRFLLGPARLFKQLQKKNIAIKSAT